MSLRSTLTNASINGWSTNGQSNFIQRQVMSNPFPPAQNFYQLVMSGDGNTIISRIASNNGSFSALIAIYNKDINGIWQRDTSFINVPESISWLDISYDGLTFIAGSGGLAGSGGIGEAYIYVNSGGTWSNQAILTPSDGPKITFGTGVSMSDDGNNVIVGCPRESTTNYGSAYIFTRSGSTWTQQQKIIAGDQSTDDYFGTSVSMSANGNIVAVGAPQAGLSAVAIPGKAYIFTRTGSTWSQQQKITAPALGTLRNFALRIRISGDGLTILVGGTGPTDGQTSTTLGGKDVYVFYYNGSTWTNTQIITSGMGTYGWGSDMDMNYNASIIFIGWNVEYGPYSATTNQIFPMSNTSYLFSGNNGIYSPLTNITPTRQNIYEYGIGMYPSCDYSGSTFVTDSCGLSGFYGTNVTYIYYFTIA